jgi:uncharacterized SAM-binding protein YcdF (DUF218 family)
MMMLCCTELLVCYFIFIFIFIFIFLRFTLVCFLLTLTNAPHLTAPHITSPQCLLTLGGMLLNFGPVQLQWAYQMFAAGLLYGMREGEYL